MANQSGSVSGLTFLCPIRDDPNSAEPSHDLQLRNYLAHLPTDAQSPFAVTGATHLARLVVMDDVIYVGMPSCEEHLNAKYLVFETNCDGDADAYLGGLASRVPEQVEAIWKHCIGYPTEANPAAFVSYMKACQLETTFFFAAVNDRSVKETLVALQTQRAVANFIATHQGGDPAEIQKDFLKFLAKLDSSPAPEPGAWAPPREIQTGGRNE